MLGEEQDSCIELWEQGQSFLHANALLKIVEEGIDKIILVDYLTIDVKLFEISENLCLFFWYYIQKLGIEEGVEIGFEVEFEIVVG